MPEDSITGEDAQEEVLDLTPDPVPAEEADSLDGNDRAEDKEEDMFGDDPFAEDSSEVSEEEPDTAPVTHGFDDDLDGWALKTGRDIPENDRERKLLQDIRDGQREFTKNRQAEKGAKDLSDAAKELADHKQGQEDDFIDPLEQKVAALEADRNAERASRLQSEFFQAKEISESTSKTMADILREKVDRAGEDRKGKVLDHWAHPDQLEDLYDLARARELSAGTDALLTEAASKERARIAKESRAEGPTRNAKETVANPKKDPLMDLWES